MKANKIPKLNNSDIKRLYSKIDFTTKCWIWTGTIDRYGHFSLKGNDYPAHRVAYEFFTKSKVPLNLAIDHLCLNKVCVNPTHLEVVSQQENIRRSKGSPVNKNKTYCDNGHEYTKENIWTKLGKNGEYSKVCRTCRNWKDVTSKLPEMEKIKPDKDPLVQLGWVRTSTKKKVNKLKKLVVINGVRKPETLDAVITRIIK